MHKDPVGEVRGLYDWLGVPVTDLFADNMARWWAENDLREREEKPDPALFGLDYDEVRGKFAEYLGRMEKWTGQTAA